MPDWNTLVVPSTSLMELILRGSLMFLALTALMRVVGQREPGGLGITDLLVIVLIAEAAGPGLMGNADTVGDSLVVVISMLFWSVTLDAIAYRWPRLAAVIKSKPRPLITDGHFNRRVMRREFMTEEEVRSQLRLHGISDPSEVSRAYLEPNGMISVIPASRKNVEDPPKPPVA